MPGFDDMTFTPLNESELSPDLQNTLRRLKDAASEQEHRGWNRDGLGYFCLGPHQFFFPDYQTKGFAFFGAIVSSLLALPIAMAVISFPNYVSERSWLNTLPGLIVIFILLALEWVLIRSSVRSYRHASQQQKRPTEGLYLVPGYLVFEKKRETSHASSKASIYTIIPRNVVSTVTELRHREGRGVGRKHRISIPEIHFKSRTPSGAASHQFLGESIHGSRGRILFEQLHLWLNLPAPD